MSQTQWTVGTWRMEARQTLERSGNPDADWDTDWMLCEALGCGRSELRWRAGERMHAEQVERLEHWLRERVSGRPLQYVLGNACFMGLTFRCDGRALIPRQDTETLVELALSRMQGRLRPRVLDMCTGTGAIGLSIKHYRPDAEVVLTDISDGALALAQENAALNRLSARFEQGDLFEAAQGEKFDFVLCNPPYLTGEDMRQRMREVTHEPELALFGGADGLDFYRRIADGLGDALETGGEGLLEIGKGQEKDVIALLNARGFRAEAHKDLCGVDRVIHARREERG